MKNITFLSLFMFILSLSVLSAQTIYYTDAGKWLVQSAGPDTLDSNIQTIVPDNGSTIPAKIAADGINNKLYYTDYYSDKIFRVNTDASNLEEIITGGLSNPRGIALDVFGNSVYWVDKNEHLLEKSDLDGSNRSTLLDENDLRFPDNLRIDLANNKLYWNGCSMDTSMDVICRCNPDGSNVETVVVADYGDIWSFDINPAENEIYYFWSDGTANDYIRIHTLSGSDQAADEGTEFHNFAPVYALVQDIKIDVNSGKIYWSDTANDSVSVWNLDKSGNIRAILKSDVNHILGIALHDEFSHIGDKPKAVILDFKLYQNYPNPFNPSTLIRYDIPADAQVSIDIYNAIGQKITNLFNGRKSMGRHEITWNAQPLSSGVYFMTIKAQSLSGAQHYHDIKKMIYIK